MVTFDREALQKYVCSIRRDIHRHPEISGQEFRTAQLIRNELDKMGIPYKTVGTGTVAEIMGTEKGMTVALRADIDALSVTEETGLEFQSENVGVMHACGHDFHTSALLGCAKVLSEHPEMVKKGKLLLLFQSAEETAQGALELLHSGILNDVDLYMGMHVRIGIPAGVINIEAGPREAAAGMFKIEITGSSGHGAMPHQTVDAVVVGSQIVNALQSVVSRNIDPLKPAVITVGTFNAGERFNVVAGKAVLTGTMRAYEPEVCTLIEEKLLQITENIATMNNAEAKVELKWIVPPLINNKEYTEQFVDYLQNKAGFSTITMEKVTGAEDFAYYAEKAPGVFAFFGIEDKEHKYPNHHSKFAYDEELLSEGSRLYLSFVECYCS